MNVPNNAKWYLDGSYYKIGVHGKIFRWDDDEWVYSQKTHEELAKFGEDPDPKVRTAMESFAEMVLDKDYVGKWHTPTSGICKKLGIPFRPFDELLAKHDVHQLYIMPHNDGFFTISAMVTDPPTKRLKKSTLYVTVEFLTDAVESILTDALYRGLIDQIVTGG